MFAAHSLMAENVVGIRADGNTQLFTFDEIVSVKASDSDKLIVNGTDGKKSTGLNTLRFSKESTNTHWTTSDEGIRIYPNPVSTTLFVVGATDETEISIIDTKGRIVLREKGASVNVDGLIKGLYILSVEKKRIKFIKE